MPTETTLHPYYSTASLGRRTASSSGHSRLISSSTTNSLHGIRRGQNALGSSSVYNAGSHSLSLYLSPRSSPFYSGSSNYRSSHHSDSRTQYYTSERTTPLSPAMSRRDNIIQSLIRTSHDLSSHHFPPTELMSGMSGTYDSRPQGLKSHLPHTSIKNISSLSISSDLPTATSMARSSESYRSVHFRDTPFYAYRPVVIDRPTLSNYTPRPKEERLKLPLRAITRDRPLIKFLERDDLNPAKVRSLLNSWAKGEPLDDEFLEDIEYRKRDSVRSNDSGIGSFQGSRRSRQKSVDTSVEQHTSDIIDKDSEVFYTSSVHKSKTHRDSFRASSVDEGVHLDTEDRAQTPNFSSSLDGIENRSVAMKESHTQGDEGGSNEQKVLQSIADSPRPSQVKRRVRINSDKYVRSSENKTKADESNDLTVDEKLTSSEKRVRALKAEVELQSSFPQNSSSKLQTNIKCKTQLKTNNSEDCGKDFGLNSGMNESLISCERDGNILHKSDTILSLSGKTNGLKLSCQVVNEAQGTKELKIESSPQDERLSVGATDVKIPVCDNLTQTLSKDGKTPFSFLVSTSKQSVDKPNDEKVELISLPNGGAIPKIEKKKNYNNEVLTSKLTDENENEAGKISVLSGEKHEEKRCQDFQQEDCLPIKSGHDQRSQLGIKTDRSVSLPIRTGTKSECVNEKNDDQVTTAINSKEKCTLTNNTKNKTVSDILGEKHCPEISSFPKIDKEQINVCSDKNISKLISRKSSSRSKTAVDASNLFDKKKRELSEVKDNMTEGDSSKHAPNFSKSSADAKIHSKSETRPSDVKDNMTVADSSKHAVTISKSSADAAVDSNLLKESNTEPSEVESDLRKNKNEPSEVKDGITGVEISKHAVTRCKSSADASIESNIFMKKKNETLELKEKVTGIDYAKQLVTCMKASGDANIGLNPPTETENTLPELHENSVEANFSKKCEVLRENNLGKHNHLYSIQKSQSSDYVIALKSSLAERREYYNLRRSSTSGKCNIIEVTGGKKTQALLDVPMKIGSTGTEITPNVLTKSKTNELKEIHAEVRTSGELDLADSCKSKTTQATKNAKFPEVFEANKLRRSTTTALTTSRIEEMHNKLQKSTTLSSVGKAIQTQQKPPLPFQALRKTTKSNTTDNIRIKTVLEAAKESARSVASGISSSSAATIDLCKVDIQIANLVKVENSLIIKSAQNTNKTEEGGKHLLKSADSENSAAKVKLQNSSQKIELEQNEASSGMEDLSEVSASEISDSTLEKKAGVDKDSLQQSRSLKTNHSVKKTESNSFPSKMPEVLKESKQNGMKADKDNIVEKVNGTIGCSTPDWLVPKDKHKTDGKMERVTHFIKLEEKDSEQTQTTKRAQQDMDYRIQKSKTEKQNYLKKIEKNQTEKQNALSKDDGGIESPEIVSVRAFEKSGNEINASSTKTERNSLVIGTPNDKKVTESVIVLQASSKPSQSGHYGDIREKEATSKSEVRPANFMEVTEIRVDQKSSVAERKDTESTTKGKNAEKDSQETTLQKEKVVEGKRKDHQSKIAECTKSRIKLKETAKNDIKVNDRKAVEQSQSVLGCLETDNYASIRDSRKDKNDGRAQITPAPSQLQAEVPKKAKQNIILPKDEILSDKKQVKHLETKQIKKKVKVEVLDKNLNDFPKLQEASILQTRDVREKASFISPELNTGQVAKKFEENIKSTILYSKLEETGSDNKNESDNKDVTKSKKNGNGLFLASNEGTGTIEKCGANFEKNICQPVVKTAVKINKIAKISEDSVKEQELSITLIDGERSSQPETEEEKFYVGEGAIKVKKKKIQTEGGLDKVKKKKKKVHVTDEICQNKLAPSNADVTVFESRTYHKKAELLASENVGISTAKDLPELSKADDITERVPKQSLDNLWCDYANSTTNSQQKIVSFTGTERKGYSIEDFHLLKVLGRGSYGKVMLAELKGKKHYFAIKCLRKDVVLEDNDVECTMIEKEVLAMGSSHPYLCTLSCTFQSEAHLFFVMEYLSGGDLMFHIQQSGRFPEDRARFYAAEIACALKYLHKSGIIYRDAKLDNICIDADGHVRLVDFGFCKLRVYRKECLPRNLCGTPDYMAPEIIKGYHYNQSVDWWSFGVLLYEMLVGYSPFNGSDEEELFWSVCNEEVVYPRFLSREATQILVLLLNKDPEKRLGMPGCTAGDIYCQPFFRPIDWIKAERKQLEPPFKPNLNSETDVSNFDSDFTMEKATLTPLDKMGLNSIDQELFSGFTYTNPLLFLD